jgi:hypothetical protein
MPREPISQVFENPPEFCPIDRFQKPRVRDLLVAAGADLYPIEIKSGASVTSDMTEGLRLVGPPIRDPPRSRPVDLRRR